MEKIIGKYIELAKLPKEIEFKNQENFNFAYDIIDEYAKIEPTKLAMLHISSDKKERRFTFEQISKYSSKTANYFKSLGIKKGDKVMLILRRNYQFWFSILALHKIGAIVIPTNNLLVKKDYEYRFKMANVDAVVCTTEDNAINEIELAQKSYNGLKAKIIVGGDKKGWSNFDREMYKFSSIFERVETKDTDIMIMFFTSGTSAFPKRVIHNFKYPLGHYITAKYWHGVEENGLHFTLAETGWGKALWGKLYGQWLCGASIFVYDFNVFDPQEIFSMIEKYKINTFCAPSTMYRILSRVDLGKYDISSLKHITSAGEILSKEVYEKIYNLTGLQIHEGFGQTETTLTIGNLIGTKIKPGSMGKPTPLYKIEILLPDGSKAKANEIGEIVINLEKGKPIGLFDGYYQDEEKTKEVLNGKYYKTKDMAYYDDDGYFWYVGRCDDIIKSAGYRIGPHEIESVIMELPYIAECAVVSVPDKVRGEAIKAIVVLKKGLVETQNVKKDIKRYLRNNVASYKWPKVVEVLEKLPKTTNGKVKRCEL